MKTAFPLVPSTGAIPCPERKCEPRKSQAAWALYLYVYICIQASVQHRTKGLLCYGPRGAWLGAPFLVRPEEVTASAGHREFNPASGLVPGTTREAGGTGGTALRDTFFVGTTVGVWGSGESLGEAGLERGPLSVVRSSTSSSTQRSRPLGASGTRGTWATGSFNPLESVPRG